MRKNIVFVFCMVLMLFNKGDTYRCKEIKFNNGCGTLFENGRLVTALHLVKEGDILLYCDMERDIAVVNMSEKDEKWDTKNLIFFDLGGVKNNKNYFLYIDWLIDKGDSGKAYIEDGKLKGVFIGRKGDKAIASVITDEIAGVINGGNRNVT